MKPRYPIYVPSKGRAGPDRGFTIRWLARSGISFKVVVEPPEADDYIEVVGEERVLVLPFANLGEGSIPARNWIWEHAQTAGAERHWCLDDNVRAIRRLYRGRRVPCDPGPAFAAIEDFADRYENVAIAGMAYQMFGMPGVAPLFLNVHVYSCLLIDSALEQRWRGRYNEDTDLCLQVLSAGLCTVLVNAFLIDKMTTMQIGGGNTDDLYQGDGRLRMARDLERAWPSVVRTGRRWQRPQHVVRDQWRKFDTPLRLRPDVDLEALEPNEYGLELRALKEVQSPPLRKLLEERRAADEPPATT